MNRAIKYQIKNLLFQKNFLIVFALILAIPLLFFCFIFNFWGFTQALSSPLEVPLGLYVIFLSITLVFIYIKAFSEFRKNKIDQHLMVVLQTKNKLFLSKMVLILIFSVTYAIYTFIVALSFSNIFVNFTDSLLIGTEFLIGTFIFTIFIGLVPYTLKN